MVALLGRGGWVGAVGPLYGREKGGGKGGGLQRGANRSNRNPYHKVIFKIQDYFIITFEKLKRG